MTDLLKTIENVAGYYQTQYTLYGTLAAQDYVGDTTGDAGVPMPPGDIVGAYITLDSADDGNTTVVIENETQGTTATVTLDADTFTEDTTIDLSFEAGDELSISVGSVTTPGSEANVVLHHDVDTAPMN